MGITDSKGKRNSTPAVLACMSMRGHAHQQLWDMQNELIETSKIDCVHVKEKKMLLAVVRYSDMTPVDHVN